MMEDIDAGVLQDGEDPQLLLELCEQELSQVEAEIERLLARQQHLTDQRERLRQRLAVELRAPRADWQGSFQWDAEVAAALGLFGLTGFRPLQREVINATLQGRDCLCLLPAGGGKSLCYQLPAVMAGRHGTTLVVSPLLSLIQDQVLGLTSMNIQAAALTSLTSKEEAAEVNQLLDNPKSGLRLLYCTPEKIVNSKRFMARLEKLHRAGRLERVAIDEAHCCSSWGNDFRPDYKKLGVLKQQFPDVPVLALTATATQAVCDDLKAILRIDAAEVFRSPTNRPNLMYEVVPKPATADAAADDIAGWVRSNFPGGESGIVYCLTRKDCESVAQQLKERGLAAAHYHADMDPAARTNVHNLWSQGKLQVIVATIAFGMGINKADVRFVIHHSLSKSIENYYQESGRAGRDGKPAHCRLYFRLADYLRQAQVVVMESGWERHLNAMLGYVAAHTCRRSIISRHFGEAPSPCHGMCDVCQAAAAAAAAGAAQAAGPSSSAKAAEGGTRQRDVTAAAQGALSTLANWTGAEKRATLTQLLDAWRKSKNAAHAAAAKSLSKDEQELVIQQLLLQGCLQLDFGFSAYATNVYMKTAARASSVLQGKRQVHIMLPQPRGDGYGMATKPASGQQQQQQQTGPGKGQQQQQQTGPGKGQQQQQQMGQEKGQLGAAGSGRKQQQQPSSKQAGKRRQPAPAEVVSLLTDSDSDLEDPLKHRQQQQQQGKRSRP